MTKNQKKTLSLLIFTLAIFFQTEAQKCATTLRDSVSLLNNPEHLKIRAERLAEIHSFNKRNSKIQHPLVYIPTVVHIIHTSADGTISDDPDIGNISDEQIMSQIEVLNNDYRRKAGTPGFNNHPDGADLEIQFCLAKLDPNGNPTNGITRHFRDKDVYNPITDDREIKRIVQWPPDQYMNVYVVPQLKDNFLGYASFPDEPREYDGIVMSNRFFGNRIGTAIDAFAFPYNSGRTMTHEVGHWLGLVHIWGDGGCSVDDGCPDTPDSDAGNYGCDTTHVSCTTVDMVRNYMDYSDDDCFNIFTNCQKSIARSVFEESIPNNRSTFYLNSLIGTINCGENTDTVDNSKLSSEILLGTVDQQQGRYIIYNLAASKIYRISLYGFQGQKIEERSISTNASGELIFDLGDQRSGLYILKLDFLNGDSKQFKLFGSLY